MSPRDNAADPKPARLPFETPALFALAALVVGHWVVGAWLYLSDGGGAAHGLATATDGRPVPTTVLAAPSTVAAMDLFFQNQGLDLERVRRGEQDVPRAMVAGLPVDLATVRPVNTRKRTFIKALLPLILAENERIREDRRKLLVAMGAENPNDQDRATINRLAKAYATQPIELVKRVNTVPPSIALAQAAIESAWGTSRFATLGNALYGQWTWKRGTGIVPLGRDEGQSHEIRRFDTPRQSVAAYLHNLNTHPAYQDFRALRAKLGVADGLSLVDTLVNYSTRREAYVDELKTVIKVNRLYAFDRARLRAAAE